MLEITLSTIALSAFVAAAALFRRVTSGRRARALTYLLVGFVAVWGAVLSISERSLIGVPVTLAVSAGVLLYVVKNQWERAFLRRVIERIERHRG